MALSQLHRDRITKLRDTLLIIPEERFNMNTWGHRNRNSPVSVLSPETVKFQHLDCGFAGCVYGHMPTAFWDDGWRWLYNGHPVPPEGEPTGEVVDAVQVMASFLGLTENQAAYIARPECYYSELEQAEYKADWVRLITPEVAAGHLTEILRCDAAGEPLPEPAEGDDGSGYDSLDDDDE